MRTTHIIYAVAMFLTAMPFIIVIIAGLWPILLPLAIASLIGYAFDRREARQ